MNREKGEVERIMQCPSCKEQIDDDSRYCDQCGEQIMVCSVCGRPGRGKRCIFDGKEMVAAGSAGAPSPTVSPIQTTSPIVPPMQPVQPVQQMPQGTVSSNKVKITSQMHGIMIEAGDGDIIGRKNGTFANIFSRFNYVSGTHCKIVKTTAGWHIQDMGSTNHTYLPGIQLDPITPNILYPLANGTTVRIADVELLVTYDTDEGGTSRL